MRPSASSRRNREAARSSGSIRRPRRETRRRHEEMIGPHHAVLRVDRRAFDRQDVALDALAADVRACPPSRLAILSISSTKMMPACSTRWSPRARPCPCRWLLRLFLRRVSSASAPARGGAASCLKHPRQHVAQVEPTSSTDDPAGSRRTASRGRALRPRRSCIEPARAQPATSRASSSDAASSALRARSRHVEGGAGGSSRSSSRSSAAAAPSGAPTCRLAHERHRDPTRSRTIDSTSRPT